MQAVLPVNVHAIVAVSQGKDDAGHEAALGSGRDDRVHAIRQAGEVAVRFHVVRDSIERLPLSASTPHPLWRWPAG